MMQSIILLALLCVFTGAVLGAENLKLSWDLPTKRVNGDALGIEDLDYTTVIWVCNGKEGSRDIPIPETHTMVGVPGPGECLYYLTATDKDGQTSERSAPYEYIPEQSAPAQPENVTSEIIY